MLVFLAVKFKQIGFCSRFHVMMVTYCNFCNEKLAEMNFLVEAIAAPFEVVEWSIRNNFCSKFPWSIYVVVH